MDHLDFRSVGQLLCVRVRGQLTRDTYETLASLVKQQVQQRGAIRVLMELCDFCGWADEAEWEDADFDPWQWLGIERLALVGDPKWSLAIAIFARSLTTAEMRHFDREALELAKTWLAAPQPFHDANGGCWRA